MRNQLQHLHLWGLATGLLLLAGTSLAAAETARLSGLTYFPEGDAIVCVNGSNAFNRPLYCRERYTLIKVGELPSVSSPFVQLQGAYRRGGVEILFSDFSERIARYRPGLMEWELSDPRLPAFKAQFVVTTLADATGFTARFTVVAGGQPGDQTGWMFVPNEPEKKVEYHITRKSNGFDWEPAKQTPLAQLQARFSAPVAQWNRAESKGPNSILNVEPLASETLQGCGLVAWLPVQDRRPLSLAVVADENEPKTWAMIVVRRKLLDPAVVADPAKAFDAGLARVKGLGQQVVVETPDPHFDAGVRASVAAAFGLFVEPCFVHGGSAWRNQAPGWRTMGAALNYGFHDQIKRCVAFWDTLQVKTNKGSSQGAYSANGCQQATGSRFLGAGFVDYKQPPHYEFQTQFFDEAVRAWRATADPALEKTLLPMLELHLTRCLECYDPDGDGLYESYNNTWPNDSVWVSGGGTVEQSAYMYYGRRAAADMRRRLGDAKAAAAHDAIADKIQKALDRVLWLAHKGYYAAYVEQGGHQRVHDDAWIYSEHLPIEAGMSTPIQAWQAMYYTEWAMERFPFAFGGEMRQTSNWVPGQWSIRETYPGDNFGMALGYFLAGQGDEGWKLLSGTMRHSMYGDPSPMKGYGNESGTFGRQNLQSPGGLSHPNCGIDFNDITSSFGRAVVEGVFGYEPDYPNNSVRLHPAFPSNWDHGSIYTPDFSLAYRQKGSSDIYQVSLLRSAQIQFRVPVRARGINSVTLNGKPVAPHLQPWTGCGMLTVTVPQTNAALLEIVLEERGPHLEALSLEQSSGAYLDINSRFPVKRILDPQGSLVNASISGTKVRGQCAASPGHHLLQLELTGEVPCYQPVKLHITDPAGEAARAAQSPRVAPQGAQWKCLDLTGVFNGDISTIFKQQYRSPRPDTVSMRIGYDGWSAWTFTHWKIPVPEIKLDGVAKLTGPDGRLRTEANVPFLPPDKGTNIAFTSLWDNWPRTVTVPVNASGDAIWLLVCGSSNPMQLRIANAVLRFKYSAGKVETLDLVPPQNFWSLCRFGRVDYDYARDGFALPKDPPPQVQLGENCRAILCGWKLRPGAKLESFTLETLSPEVIVGLMGASVMNPDKP